MKQPALFIGRKISIETANWLKHQKVLFEEHPLFRIEWNEPECFEFSTIGQKKRQFAITSRWAAKWLVKNAAEIGFNNSDSVFCLSEKQRNVCSRITQNIFISEESNAESLAKLIQAKNKNEQVVFLCGNRSLDVLEMKLNQNHRFKKVEVYRNLPLFPEVKSEFDFYLFFSPGSVENFYKAGNTIPKRSKIVTIGSSTAKACLVFFRNEILASPVQEEIAMVKYAAALMNQQEYHQ